MKKILKVSLIVLFILTLICSVNVFAAITEGNYQYTKLGNKGMFANTPYANTSRIEKYTGKEKNVVIPSQIGGRKVSMLLANGSPVFDNNKYVQTVTIPEGVLSLDGIIFNNCKNLTTVVIPSTIKEIKGNIAINCPNLKLQLPEGLEKMPDGSYRAVQEITIRTKYDYDTAIECFNATNKYRVEQGKTKLKLSSKLTDVAMKRAAELAYHWDHTRPNGLVSNTIWWNVAGGENIYWCSGLASGYSMFASWRDSAGHREQMLKDYHTSIVIGCVTVNGQTFGVQIFSNSKELESDNEKVKTGKKDSVDKVQISELYDTVSMQIKGLNKAIELLSGETTSATEVKLYNKGENIPSLAAYVKVELSDVIWKSSDENVFTVDKNGVVTAKNTGKATLTAKVGDQEETFNITVKEMLNCLKINNENLSLNEGETKKLEVTNTTNTSELSWKSSNNSVLTVDSEGVVTAIKGGTAIVTVSAGDKTDSITITVKRPNVVFAQQNYTILVSEESEIDVEIQSETDVTWKILDTDIATVDKNGKVSGLKAGTTTLIAESSDGSVAKCEVTIIDFLKGDMDGNGIVNGTDAAMILDIYNRNNGTENDLLIGDIDNNNILNGTDAAMILDMYNKVL